MINVREHGVREYMASDSSVEISGPAIEALMKSYPEQTLYFPAGDYMLSNETTGKQGLVIGPEFHGSLLFASSASLVCNTANKRAGTCVHFLSASHVSAVHMNLKYADQQALPMARAAATGYAVLIDASSDIHISAMTIQESPGACFWASDSSELVLRDIHVSRCTADGVHFENDKNVDLQDMWSSHTLDDGLAFTSVAVTHPNCGAVAKGIHIEESSARGIAVAGGCDIALSNFEINRTGVSGILVNTDDAFHMRRPQNVSFRDGVVAHAGALESSSGSGNKFGIEVSAADRVSFAGLQIISPASRGFDVSHGATFVSLSESSITKPGDNGMNILNSSNILLSLDTVQYAPGYGAYLAGISGFKGTHLTLIDVSSGKAESNLHRALWVDSPSGSTRLEYLKIIDDQSAATGYVVGCANIGKQDFLITGLSSSIRQQSLRVECAGEIRTSAF